ncbi:DUF2267 domain-containing protein [Streptomyces sp. AM6-12]|uniref:DUF2267 domain-containing protein n=1 Tax=Streptomyces sp. AM6-12 TaxID=3345149 RepID=UPI00378DD6F7
MTTPATTAAPKQPTIATPKQATNATPKQASTAAPKQASTAAPKQATDATLKTAGSTAPRASASTVTAAVPLPKPHPSPADSTSWESLTEAVREAGRYPTRAEAERITRIVLSALGSHVTGDERVVLAQSLPPEAGRLIAAQIPVPEPLTAREFVDSVSTRLPDSTPATARWDVSSVLTTLSTYLTPDLTDRILSQLPPGYALLFGRAELAPMA